MACSPIGSLRSAIGLALVVCMGCHDYPARVEAPDWQPAALAAAAMQDLDTNKDGELDSSELSAAPGLAAGAALLDTDKNQLVSAEELQQRFETYKRLSVGRTSGTFRFLAGNRPLAGANVEFVPESFLEGVIQPATATTNQEGLAYPQTVGESVPGMQVGYYRIQVTAPDGRVSAKYADQSSTPLGAEVSGTNDDPMGYKVPIFRLDSK